MPDFGWLLDALPQGDLMIPSPPPGAVDPWTAEAIAVTAAGTVPQLRAPIEVPIDLTPPAAPAVVDAPAAAAAAVTVPPEAIQATTIVTPRAGTAITREEVLALLAEVEATIYLMV